MLDSVVNVVGWFKEALDDWKNSDYCADGYHSYDDIKNDYERLKSFLDVSADNLSSNEALLLWYLRNGRRTEFTYFFKVAKKRYNLYAAYLSTTLSEDINDQ